MKKVLVLLTAGVFISSLALASVPKQGEAKHRVMPKVPIKAYEFSLKDVVGLSPHHLRYTLEIVGNLGRIAVIIHPEKHHFTPFTGGVIKFIEHQIGIIHTVVIRQGIDGGRSEADSVWSPFDFVRFGEFDDDFTRRDLRIPIRRCTGYYEAEYGYNTDR